MKRLVLTISTAALLITLAGKSSGPFDSKLTKDQQILHVLNRLTFGPRPGDIEEVRRIGIEKWIGLQLHPERIPESPILEAKLKLLETLRMEPAEIIKEYSRSPLTMMVQPLNLTTILSQDQLRKVMSGTAEERKAALEALGPDKLKQVLPRLPSQTLAGLPELQKEAEAAREAEVQERQAELRRRMPSLNDLLSPDEVIIAMRGNTEQLKAIFEDLDPLKRQQVAAAMPPQALAAFPELRRAGLMLRAPQMVVSGDLKEGKIFRAVYSKRQLEEVLVDFWFNHFNVFENKAADRLLLSSYERDAIRPHVLGHFKDLLLATARHPAMLYFLDNWESVWPEAFEIGPFAGAAGQMTQQLSRSAHGLNENYGREVMELHTLGVKGGYTQEDVIAVARCFTGWTIRNPYVKPEFVFAPFMHDSGEKVVLGHKIAAGGGEQDGLQVIDILAHHPSTAKFISRKLAQRFVADDPPQSLVDRMAQTFTRTDGDLRAVLETMFSSTEFLSEGAWEAKMKSPLEVVVSAVRAMQAEVTDAYLLAQRVSDLGEPLYNKQDPPGYPNTGDAWLNTAGLLGRMRFGMALASGEIPGVILDPHVLEGKDTAAIARELLGRDASAETQEAIQHGLDGKPATPRRLASLLISSPDFQRR